MSASVTDRRTQIEIRNLLASLVYETWRYAKSTLFKATYRQKYIFIYINIFFVTQKYNYIYKILYRCNSEANTERSTDSWSDVRVGVDEGCAAEWGSMWAVEYAAHHDCWACDGHRKSRAGATRSHRHHSWNAGRAGLSRSSQQRHCHLSHSSPPTAEQRSATPYCSPSQGHQVKDLYCVIGVIKNNDQQEYFRLC